MSLMLIVIIVVLAVTAPNFLEPNNIVNIMRQSSINAMLAVGMTFVILTGGIDLSVGSMLGVGGVAAVWLSVQGVPSILAVLGAIALCGLFGLVNGVLVSKFLLPSFIVTIGSLTYLRGLAYVGTGGQPLVSPDLGFSFLGLGSVGPIPWPVIIAVIMFGVGYLVLNHTPYGRHIYAIGGNKEAARLSGINVDRVLLSVYVISGLCAGVAGVVFSARLLSALPTGGQTYELFAIAAVILGGTRLTGGVGSIFGTLIGALILGVLSNGLVLLNVPFFYQNIVTGVVIILAVLLDRLRVKQSGG